MKFESIEKTLLEEFRTSVWDKFLSAVEEYKLIKNGDNIAVCISGGKDSMLLAKCMQELKKQKLYDFEAVFMVMNPGYNQRNKEMIENNANILNIPIKMFESNIFEVVSVVDDSPCYLCARMRRGFLYKNAKDLGCNKISLGHHMNDVIETILMGILYNGQIQTMMPRIKSANFEGMELIRPLYKVKEKDIISWKNRNNLTFLQCACRFTENISKNDIFDSKRKEMKLLIERLRTNNPDIEENIFNSMYEIDLTEIIGYKGKQK